MTTHVIVYIGGPRHGERQVRRGEVLFAPREIVIPGKVESYRYSMRPLADVPGALAYIYEPECNYA